MLNCRAILELPKGVIYAIGGFVMYGNIVMKLSYLKLSALLTGVFISLLCFSSITLAASQEPSAAKEPSATKELSAKQEPSALVKMLYQMETEFNNRNSKAIRARVDIDSLLKRTFVDIETDERFIKEFTKGFKQKGAANLINSLINVMNDESTTKLLSYDENPAAQLSKGLFRFNHGEQGFGYVRFYIKNQGGQLKVVDWFDYARGQELSKSLAMTVRSVAPSKGIVGKFKDIGSGKGDFAVMFTRFSKLYRAQNFDGLKKMFKESDEQMRTSWEMMAGMATMASLSNDNNFYLAVLKSIDKNFNKQAKAGFVLLDYYFLTQQYSKVIPILDVLLAQIGVEDAGLLHMKSNTYHAMQDYKNAKASAVECKTSEPDYIDCYWNLVTFAIEQKQHDDLVKQLKVLGTQFGYVFSKENFEGIEAYQHFVGSAEFESWLGGNEANAQGTTSQ